MSRGVKCKECSNRIEKSNSAKVNCDAKKLKRLLHKGKKRFCSEYIADGKIIQARNELREQREEERKAEALRKFCEEKKRKDQEDLERDLLQLRKQHEAADKWANRIVNWIKTILNKLFKRNYPEIRIGKDEGRENDDIVKAVKRY